MKKETFLSPIALIIAFSVLFAVWFGVFLHTWAQSPHYHIVERLMFSGYFTLFALMSLLLGLGLIFTVFSGVLWAVHRLLGVNVSRSETAP